MPDYLHTDARRREEILRLGLDTWLASCDTSPMTDADRLRNAAAELKIKNRRNKLKFKVIRAERAKVAAELKGYDHPLTFPTRYKYG